MKKCNNVNNALDMSIINNKLTYKNKKIGFDTKIKYILHFLLNNCKIYKNICIMSM